MAKLPQPQPTSSTRSPSCSAELAAHQSELGLLGLLERRRASLEVGAAVGHRGVQEQGEELVAGVVVVADRAPVTADRVALAAQPQLGLRRPRRPDQPAGADQRDPEPSDLRRGQLRRLERVDDLQRRLDVVDVDQPEHVGAAQPELSGSPDHVRERLRGAELERRARRPRWRARRSRPRI